MIGGGSENIASGETCTIGGGYGNYTAGEGAVVSGGGTNTSWAYSAADGGAHNEAYAYFATISGGEHNVATGWHSTVAGGSRNSTSGHYSFAAGRRAKATHQGAFVWGDSQDVDKTSSADDEFNVYASGGTRIFSNAAATAGVLLAPGGGSWSSVSDRDSKEHVESVDARDVLARVAALPISTWNYEAQADSIRHMGPMAQDFHAAFGLGVSDKMIDTIDVDGVALAALQGLHELLREKDDQIRKLEERVARLEGLVSR